MADAAKNSGRYPICPLMWFGNAVPFMADLSHVSTPNDDVAKSEFADRRGTAVVRTRFIPGDGPSFKL
jgi:hypothetical protein